MAEVVTAVFVGGVVAQQPQQGARVEDVVAHGGIHALVVGVFLVEVYDLAVGGSLDDPEFGRLIAVHGDGRHGDLRRFVGVVLDHAGDVHAVDVIAAENRHHVRVRLLHQVDVLVDGVGGPLVPRFAGRAHLRRHRNHELRLEQLPELPALAQVLQQGLAAELGQDV